MNRKSFALILVAAVLVTAAVTTTVSRAGDETDADHREAAQDPAAKLETLLKTALEGVEGVEVVVSRVTIAPNSSLPKHWHPGEEFVYILEGDVVLWQDGKEDLQAEKGDAVKVPLKQVHTAMTGDSGATVLVFRVHEAGQPERILVD